MPIHTCTVATCNNAHYKSKSLLGPHISYHKSPKDLELRKIWLERCGVEDDNKRFIVCSEHFEKYDFKTPLQYELLAVRIYLENTIVYVVDVTIVFMLLFAGKTRKEVETECDTK